MDLSPEIRMRLHNYKQMEHIPSMYHNIKQQVVSSLEMVNMEKLLRKEFHVKAHGEVLYLLTLKIVINTIFF